MTASALALPVITPLEHLPASPWRNGGGTTRVIATSALRPDGLPTWRISIATVRDGAAFSPFPEYERILLPLEPGSIALVSAAGELRPQPDGSSRFSGGDAITARVPAGEALALNVMALPGLAAPLPMRRVVSGDYANADPAVRAAVLVRGSIVRPDGGVVEAPAVLAPGVSVSAIEAEIVEVVLYGPADENREGAA